MLSKADGVDSQDIDQIANQSAKEFRESGKMNIFKPQLTGMTPRKQESALKPVKPTHDMHGAQPRKKVQAWADRPGSSALNKSQPLAIQNGNPAGSRLDAIYAQLRDLQNLKDEICDDLDDFVSEVDHNEAVEIP